jgi:hypothetical protein
MGKEANIVYENGLFYAYQVKGGFEIRKNRITGASLIGTASTKEQAIRFIDRAMNYPERF